MCEKTESSVWVDVNVEVDGVAGYQATAVG